jgi:hypothetical protein
MSRRKGQTNRPVKQPSPHPHHSQSSNQNSNTAVDDPIARSVKNATWIIAGATIVNVVVVGLQWNEMNAGGKDTQKLIAAAENSAKAAQDAVHLAKDTADRQLRAYLVVQDINCKLDNAVIDCSVVIKNFGSTPALDLKLSGNISAIIGDEIVHPKMTPHDQKLLVGNGWVTTLKAEWNMGESGETLNAMKKGTSLLLLAGYADYRDIYRNSHRLSFNLKSLRFQNNEWIMLPEADGNETD